MGRKKRRIFLANLAKPVLAVNEQITDSVTVVPEIVKEEPEPVVAEVVAEVEVEVEVPSVITEASEAVKPPEKLVKTPRKK